VLRVGEVISIISEEDIERFAILHSIFSHEKNGQHFLLFLSIGSELPIEQN